MAHIQGAAQSAQFKCVAPRASSSALQDGSGLPSWKMKKVAAYVAQNLSEKISGETLANLCGLSLSHFHRSFHTSFGLSPHRYIVRMRLEAARDMLQDTDLPIKIVALECGMFDQAHLTRVMRSLLATTPAAVRRRRIFNALPTTVAGQA